MKRKLFLSFGLAAIIAVAAVNLYLSSASASSADEIFLDNVESLAAGEGDLER